MKVAFLSNYTVDLIAREFRKISSSEVYISEFNHYQLDIINMESAYYKNCPDYSVLLLDGNTLTKNKSFEEVKEEIDHLFSRNKKMLNNYFIISNIHVSDEINTIHNYNLTNNPKKLQNEINLYLNKLAAQYDNFFVLDILSIIETFGSANLTDNSMWVYGKVRFNKKGTTLAAQKLKQLINAINNSHKKCLVVDLDNTLWGGIIGEDGVDSLQIGCEGIGGIFLEFQRKIRQIKEKGILLAICSKNNPEDVSEVFNGRALPLSLEDFVVKKINWNAKDQNIHDIASELNIGEDSIVFVDDNPVERAIVKQNTLAEVPDFPAKAEDLLDFVKEIDECYFPKLKLTEEDVLKTRQYEQNIKREQLKSGASSLEEFVKSLNMVLTITRARKDLIPRIAQLTQKTNQFNFTTKRYSENEIAALLENPDYKIFVGNVKDKFGDNGWVVLLILKIENGAAQIDTFLMSCRVIGRFVENGFISGVINRLGEVDIIKGEYIPNPKNQSIKNKFEELGFTLTSEEGGIKHYEMIKAKYKNQEIMEVVYEG